MDNTRLSLAGALRALRDGRVTSEQLTRDCIARSARLAPRLKPWAWFDPQRAIAHAQAADHHRLSGQPLGALHGIPVGIKDVIDTAGIPTRMGSPLYADNVPAHSATVVQRLEAAGAFTLGKTVTAELAFLTPGPTVNPWHPAHTPGGSSSGSAAAVAARLVPAALGTQTNGSVIRPAAFCGVVGYKPSFGLLPRTGVLPFSHTLDHVGVFARRVHDAALVATALAGADPLDPDSRSAQALGAATLGELIRPPRLLAVRSPVWALAGADQQQAFAAAIARMREDGAWIEERELPAVFAQAHAAQRTIMAYESARSFADLQARHRAQLSDPLNKLIDEGHALDDNRYRAAQELRRQLRAELDRLLEPYEALMTPAARGEAPAVLTETGDPTFCTIWTLCGVPALTLPCGLGPRGLPLGLQLVAGYGLDVRLWRAAEWCEHALAFAHEPPDS
jgi:Asp-tRNA(Asn)/Glu-tRNA(Gln) amidotransferase A subunit family amidase